tara:strand:- start:193 stop:624 length:432 start_codon:yes stop_codon:yes gene_type:complete
MSINIDHQQNTIASSSKTITVDHTGSIVVPKGTTAERPSAPVDGAIRFNTDLTQLEVLISSSWEKVNAGAIPGQDVFNTVVVSGQSNVVADSTTDTMTFVAGTGMTITTDAGTDTITFASSGGSSGGGIDEGDAIAFAIALGG